PATRTPLSSPGGMASRRASKGTFRPWRRWSMRQCAEGRARNVVGSTSSASGPLRSLEEDEAGVVGSAHAARLIAVAHDADALQFRDVLVEVLPEELLGIDCLFFPIAGGRAAAQDDAVGGHERVAYPVAGRPDRSVRAPDELERIPAQTTLPGDVDGRGRIAETA